MPLYDDYDMGPVIDNGDLPWDPGIETAWAKKAWAALQDGDTTSALCNENSLQAAYLAGLALFFNDFEILAWGESADCIVSDWVDHLERNDPRIAIEAYKRGLINDKEIENTERDALSYECIEQLAIALRDDIAKAVIKGFGGKDRLLHAFLALERARERSSLNWAMRDPDCDNSVDRVTVPMLRKEARFNSWMIDDFGSGPELDALVMVALWVERDCPYLQWMRD